MAKAKIEEMVETWLPQVARLAELVEAELYGRYELVRVDYRDELSEDQVDWLMAGDHEAFYDDTSEWESDQRWSAALDVVDELARDIARREFGDDAAEVIEAFNYSDERMGLVELVMERDASDWLDDLVRNTPAPLMRVTCSDEHFIEDAMALVPECDAADWIANTVAALIPDVDNAEAVEELLSECNFDHLLVPQLLFAPDDFKAVLWADAGDLVTIRNPWLWVGNPLAGNGWAARLSGEVTVDRARIATDRAGAGYSWQEVAGASAGHFACEVRVRPRRGATN